MKKFYLSWEADNGKTIEDIYNFLSSIIDKSFMSVKYKSNYHELGSYDSVELYADYQDDIFDEDFEDGQDNEYKMSALKNIEELMQQYIYG